jgi:primary-amine oxidase
VSGLQPFLAVLSYLLLVSQSAFHPLEPLSTEEYRVVYDVIIASGHLDADTHLESVLLHEPSKSVVLAWKRGDPVPREADVLLQRKEKVVEARVDIGARKLESWREVPGVQGPVSLNEILGLNETILADDRVKKALAKRGVVDLNSVECASLPIGFFAFPEQKDQRIGIAECALMHGVYRPWGRYIGGLHVEVDFANKKVLQVFDEEVTPVPGPTNYEEVPEMPRPGTTPGIITQPLGPSFQINNGEVAWQNWHFRFRLDSRVGPIVSLVSIDDAGKRRSILYEGMLSELFVPYMDPSRGWSTRVFLDAGEFYPGGVLQSLREGLDCPSNAVYFNGLTVNDKGNPVLRPHQACLFERFAGGIAWRHGDDAGVGTSIQNSSATLRGRDWQLRLPAGLEI